MQPEEIEIEKRRFARISNHFFVRSVKVELAEENIKLAGIVHDISEGGLAFLTEESYVPGDLLELEIELAGIEAPDGGERGLLNSAVIVTPATVSRVGPFEFGPNIVAVSFNDLQISHRQLLLKALSRIPSYSSD